MDGARVEFVMRRMLVVCMRVLAGNDAKMSLPSASGCRVCPSMLRKALTLLVSFGHRDHSIGCT